MRMTKIGRSAVVVVATVSLLVMAGVCGSLPLAGAASNKGPIVVGAPVALSGAEAAIGVQDAALAQKYVKQINAHGGVHGRKIELKVMDTKTSPTTGLLDARQLITQDHAAALVGISTTTLGEALLPLVKKYKVPTLADIGGGTFNHPVSPYFFKIPETPSSVAQVLLDYMNERGLKKIAWLGIDSAFGQSGLPQFEKVAKKNGQKLLDTLMYSPTSTNLTSYLERVKGLAGEQALLVYGIPPTAFIAQSEIASAGITVPVFQGNGVALGTFPKAVGAAANGVTLVGGNVNDYKTLPAKNPQLPVIKSFMKLYGSANRFAGDMYDCLNLLVKAMRAVGTKGPAIERYLQTKVVRSPGVTGVFSFSSKAHSGVLSSSLSVMKVVNGKFKLIATGSKILAARARGAKSSS